MSKFKIGEFVKVVNFDVADAANLLLFCEENYIRDGKFEVVEISEQFARSSFCLRIPKIRGARMAIHWWFFEEALDHLPDGIFCRCLAYEHNKKGVI